MIKHGPVDVMVMAFGEPRFDGSVLAELEKRSADGTIRVLDLLVMFKDEEGEGLRLNLTDLPPEQAAAIDFIVGETLDLFDAEDEATFLEGMVPGSAVVALAIEHTWAVDLVNAMVDSGFDMAINYRVSVADVEAAFAALEA
jgi:hypothetical protein